MPSVILHITSDQDLPTTSSRVFRLLGIANYEEHEGSNYPPDGKYFKGVSGNLIVKVTPEDDVGYENYQYWVIVSGRGSKADLEEAADQIAVKLLKAGYNVSRAADADSEKDIRLVYQLDSWGDLIKKRERVLASSSQGV